MKNTFYIFILLLSIFACNGKKTPFKEEVKNDFISIQFKNLPTFNDSLNLSKNEFITFKTPYISYFTRNGIILQEIENRGNKEKLNVDIYEDTIFLKLRYSFNQFETFILYKGDSALVNYSNEVPKIKIRNRAVKRYDYNLIELFKKDDKPLDNFSFLIKNGKLRKKEEHIKYTKDIKLYNTKIEIQLDSLKSAGLLSNDVYTLNAKGLFYSKDKKLREKQGLIKDSCDLHIDSFKTLLFNYVESHVKPISISQPNGYVFNSKKAFDFVEGNDFLHKRSKEFLLWHYLKRVAGDFSANEFESRYHIFKQTVGDENLIEDIKSEFLVDFADVNKKTKDVFLLTPIKEKTSLGGIIENHPGKVIFIDFWASWCLPCRKVMPETRKLVESYKNNDIIFLFISIDKNFSAWQKASGEEKLDFSKNNLLAINYPLANFYKELDLKTIPRYLLYNKQGELVHENAPGANTQELRALLDKYLKE